MNSNGQVKPLITVGIAFYNAGDTIDRAVRSALAQDWPSVEVIIVDDCSTDGSSDRLMELAFSEPRLRVIRHEQNTGVGGVRQSILRHARGEFLAYFDDDDDNVPDRLTAQYQRIVEYEHRTGTDLVFCYSNRDVVKTGAAAPDHVGHAIGRMGPEPRGTAVADYLLAIGRDSRFIWGLSGSCTLMARREGLARVGGFDAAFRRCAELDMAIRGAFMGAHFIAVDRSLITQFKTKSGDKAGNIPLKYSLMLREKHRSYLSGKHLYLASRAMARASFYGSKGKPWRSRVFLAMACLLGPSLAVSGLRRRIARMLASAR